MIPSNLIKYAVAVALLYASVGQLLHLVRYSRIQALKVLRASQSSQWGKVWIP